VRRPLSFISILISPVKIAFIELAVIAPFIRPIIRAVSPVAIVRAIIWAVPEVGVIPAMTDPLPKMKLFNHDNGVDILCFTQGLDFFADNFSS
jgi:hypothetical protein